MRARVARRRRQPRPGGAPGKALGVEPGGFVADEPRRQDFGLPRPGRRLESFQRGQRDRQRIRPFQARVLGHVLPREQEAQEIARGDRLDFRAQPPDGVMMDAREQAAVAPLLVVAAGR